jgi:hypothetical protein
LSLGTGSRPNPSMMPKRSPNIPLAPPGLRKRIFAIADDIPQRGWDAAVAWPDTGVLLVLGMHSDLPARFRDRYPGRINVATQVSREVRSHSDGQAGPNEPESIYLRVQAARAVVRSLLLGSGSLPILALEEGDLTAVDVARDQLAALSADPKKKHGGEAEIIVLARKNMRSDGPPQVMFTNDGAASVVASKMGVPSRHSGHLLAELACHDMEFTPAEALTYFTSSLIVTSPPRVALMLSEANYTCQAQAGVCKSCDLLQTPKRSLDTHQP